jgi:hypothetical protein
MPRSTSSGFRTVVWSTVVRMTGSRDSATRPAKPAPSGMRTLCRTSSSMPLAAVATSWPAARSSSSTAAVSAWSTFFTRSARGLSSDCSSSLDSAASVAAGALRCQVSDAGLGAGPWPLRPGHGLWVVRAVADEVTASSGPRGGPGS